MGTIIQPLYDSVSSVNEREGAEAPSLFSSLSAVVEILEDLVSHLGGAEGALDGIVRAEDRLPRVEVDAVGISDHGADAAQHQDGRLLHLGGGGGLRVEAHRHADEVDVANEVKRFGLADASHLSTPCRRSGLYRQPFGYG